MITYIVPTRDVKNLHRLTLSLIKLGEPFELIPIEGAKSFFDAWKKALPKVKTEWVILTHEDTEFHYIPKNEEFDLGGVAGCTKYTNKENYPWWFDVWRLKRGELSGRIYHDAPATHNIPGSQGLSVFGDYGECELLDGVCLATKTKLLEEILKDIKVDVTWDWYDQVLSHEYKKRGLIVKTIPILMTHRSAGGEKRPSRDKELKNYLKYYD